MRADKAKVVDEVWDDERITSFLDKGPLGQENEQYSQLLYAYRSMRVEDFQRFLTKFTAAGGNPQAQNTRGETLGQTIAEHKKAAPFIALLNG